MILLLLSSLLISISFSQQELKVAGVPHIGSSFGHECVIEPNETVRQYRNSTYIFYVHKKLVERLDETLARYAYATLCFAQPSDAVAPYKVDCWHCAAQDDGFERLEQFFLAVIYASGVIVGIFILFGVVTLVGWFCEMRKEKIMKDES